MRLTSIRLPFLLDPAHELLALFCSAKFIPGDGLVINDNPMFMTKPAMVMSGFNGGGNWGFNNGGGGLNQSKGAKSVKGGVKSAKGGTKGYVVVNDSFQTAKGTTSKGYQIKGSKVRAATTYININGVGNGDVGSKAKQSKSKTSKSFQMVGGIFNRGSPTGGTPVGVNGGGTVIANQPVGMGMRMRTMRSMNMVKRPTTAAAVVSQEGASTIIFRSADGRDDSDELKTKFTGTLIGYRPFT